MSSRCGEVDELDDHEILWRRVQDHLDHLTWDSDAECWRPRPTHPSNAFQFDPDMSATWERHLSEIHELGPEVVLDEAGKYSLVYAMQVEDARSLGCGVRHSPLEHTPPLCAHASVDWPDSVDKNLKREIRYGLAQAMTLIFGSPTVTPPPGA